MLIRQASQYQSRQRQPASEQRAKQLEKIKQWQPWARSTGARTPEGKARSSRNAFKAGWREELLEMAALLREQRDMLKDVV